MKDSGVTFLQETRMFYLHHWWLGKAHKNGGLVKPIRNALEDGNGSDFELLKMEN